MATEDRARVLIAEDQLVIALAMEDMLDAAGYIVCGIAYTSTSAVGLALERRPDVITMDVRLARGLDGVDTAMILRNGGVDAPIVFVTASTDPVTQERIRRVPNASLLGKPVNPGDLEAVITRALGQLVPRLTD